MSKNKIVILLEVVALVIILFLFTNKAHSETYTKVPEPVYPPVNINTLTVNAFIEEIAPKFNQDPLLISKITWCESGHKVVPHDGGRAKNVTGIHNTTFQWWLPDYTKEMGETLDIHSTYDQIKMMSWAFSKGEPYRKQWTTYVAYKNGGTYTFYSKLLKGTYIARCK